MGKRLTYDARYELDLQPDIYYHKLRDFNSPTSLNRTFLVFYAAKSVKYAKILTKMSKDVMVFLNNINIFDKKTTERYETHRRGEFRWKA